MSQIHKILERSNQYLAKYPKLGVLKSLLLDPSLQKKIMQHAEQAKEPLLQHIERGYALQTTQQYRAQVNGQDYHIYVAVPSAPPKTTSGYPVLYLLDGNAYFGTMLDSLRMQSSWTDVTKVEPVLIVAVGYTDADHIYTTLAKRAYDYLPKRHSKTWSAQLEQLLPWNRAGGADQFHDFLVKSLRPALAERYPIDLTRQSLAGHSFGGFFCLYSLLNRPNAFSQYIAMSSSIWWDNQRLLNEFEHMTKTWQPNVQAEVMIAVGEEEIPNKPEISKMMLEHSSTMAQKLKELKMSGLNVAYVEIKGENHQTTHTVLAPQILRFVSQKSNIK